MFVLIRGMLLTKINILIFGLWNIDLLEVGKTENFSDIKMKLYEPTICWLNKCLQISLSVTYILSKLSGETDILQFYGNVLYFYIGFPAKHIKTYKWNISLGKLWMFMPSPGSIISYLLHVSFTTEWNLYLSKVVFV